MDIEGFLDGFNVGSVGRRRIDLPRSLPEPLTLQGTGVAFTTAFQA